MKKIQLLSMMLFASIVCFAGDFNPQIGISLKGSTNGIGADVYFRPLKVLAVKVGYEGLGLSATSETVKSLLGNNANISVPMGTGSNLDFGLGAKYKTGSLSFQVGYQPIGLFYLTAGVGTFLLDAQVSGTPLTDIKLTTVQTPNGPVTPTITKDKLGDFTLSLAPANKIAPYFGIGLGSFVPRNGRVSFALEFGAYYMGSPKLTAKLPAGLKATNIDYGSSNSGFSNTDSNNKITEMINTLQLDLNKNVDKVNTDAKSFVVYPVVKLTIGIKAYELKKEVKQ
jgi:hypothetical protein